VSSVILDVRDGVAELVLNRPEKRNALREADVSTLRSALSEATGRGARTLLLRGEGAAFCSGRDLSTAAPGEEDGGQVLRDVFNPLILELAAMPLPTVAAVQGPCLGAGLGMALACDVMIVADDARLGSPFARIGAVLDSGAHLWLRERVGAHRALELIYTGRLLSGREAAAWGLANRTVAGTELLARARDLAVQVAAGPTTAFLLSKQIIRRIHDDGLGLAEVLQAEAEAQTTATTTADYAEGVSAFLRKTTPTFIGR
jgi:2-(1,2-epoxy-1,2-dihydrophenyl)acetyl-CoA isomerase